MKYDTFLSDYLAGTNETVGAFAKRAGVHRSTVYRAMSGTNIMIEPLERMILAAGAKLEILRNCSDSSSNAESTDA